MNEEELRFIKQWILKAEEDLLVVHQLLKADTPVTGIIGFHCQQASEKFLKALLLYHKIDVVKTHNIEYLLEKCSKIDNSFSSIDPGNLTDYGVEMR
ncbi:MAG: HEPN domain-containing protein [Bacteroidales bacterium]|jgi:HEPN domain-containing protein|nr:HEPN domain-containing protein [Bacteroidales bacterium]